MFGYAIVFGYILTNTIKYHERITTFKISTSVKNDKYYECRIIDVLTRKWFKENLESGKFKDKLIGLHGTLDSYVYSFKDLSIRKTTIVVSHIEFLDFKPSGINAIDGGKFYERNMLDWETYFSKTD